MIDDLRPYTVYKESGFPWLGRVPEHWDVRRAKLLLREVDSRSATGKEQLLRVSQYTGVTQRKSIDGSDTPDTRAKSLIGYKRVAVNDLVINIMLAWNGSLGASRHEGIVSPAYCVYRLNSKVLPWYFHELLRLPVYKGRIKVASRGVVESRLRLYTDDLGRIETIIPPLDEQTAIVRLLEHANGKIERTIRAKWKLIELLNEQKQAIIHRAVIRGLDPGVKLKLSGIPWLGDVPEHWRYMRLKNVATVQTGVTLGKDYKTAQTQSYPYLRVANVQVGRIDLRTVKEVTVPPEEAKRSMLKLGDVLMTEGGDIDKLGRGCVWNAEIKDCIHQNHIFAVRCTETMLPDFLAALMSSQHGRSYFQSTAKRTTNLASTNSTTLRAFPFFLPMVDEQRAILGKIAVETKDVDAALDRTEREITFLREYRTTLTAEVVTGKLDVREAAARLPAETAEPLLPDDLAADIVEDELADEDLEEALA